MFIVSIVMMMMKGAKKECGGRYSKEGKEKPSGLSLGHQAAVFLLSGTRRT
jgi:hypothetical protein